MEIISKSNKPMLLNQCAIVTGAGRGIGREIALQLAHEGANLIINARRDDELLSLKREINEYGRECIVVIGDVCDEETTLKLVEAVTKMGGLNILVNNAGMLDRDKTLNTTVKAFNNIVQVNLVSVFRVTQALLPQLIENKGCIVNITSSASRAPHPNANPAYGAAKAGVTALTRQWALEFAPQGVRVNAVQCGPIETEMTSTWDESYRNKVMDAIPLKRLGRPWDVARAVVYLASEQAIYITGASINLNGGKLME